MIRKTSANLIRIVLRQPSQIRAMSLTTSAIPRSPRSSPPPSEHAFKKPRLDADAASQAQPLNDSQTAYLAVQDAPEKDEKATRKENSKPEIVARPQNGAKSQKNSGAKGNGKAKGRRKGKAAKPLSSSEESTQFDILELIGEEVVKEMEEEGTDWSYGQEKYTRWDIIQAEVVGLGSFGDGLAFALNPSTSSTSTSEGTLDRKHIFVIPFCLPGERVTARIHRIDRLHSYCDLVTVDKPNPEWRDDSLVKCRYFGKCGGCQYQMLSYGKQLDVKKTTVEKAFRHFSGLPQEALPPVRPTIESPLHYGYRTKLTPHFQAPEPAHGKAGRGKDGKGKGKGTVNEGTGTLNGEAKPEAEAAKEGPEKEPMKLAMGFEEKGRRRVMDIEECPIATDVINTALVVERKKVFDNIGSYKRGATLLLRDSLPPRSSTSEPSEEEKHICITDHKAIVRERVVGKDFEFNAGSFFQNNNSVLNPLVAYVRDQVVSELTNSSEQPSASAERYLIDAYCGSGLFSIALSDAFTAVEGVEISADSVKWAVKNAEANGVINAKFTTGKAEAIFESIRFPPNQTTILIDPPRKGCDQLFLDQLLSFNPHSIIYVSCNVHSQARDVGYLIKKSAGTSGGEGGGGGGGGGAISGFRVESIRGADLFPQTHHCEGVCVLRR